jgi:hypothetical protein
MFGLLDRLLFWLDRAAAGSLEAAGEPLHPPPAYPTAEAGSVIVRADTSAVPDTSELLLVVLRLRAPGRVEIIGWIRLGEALANIEDPLLPLRRHGSAEELDLGLAIMLARPSDFEFPATVEALRAMLASHAVDDDLLLAALSLLALFRRKISEAAGRDDEAGSADRRAASWQSVHEFRGKGEAVGTEEECVRWSAEVLP